MTGQKFRRDDRAVKWTLQSYLFVVVLLGAVVVAAGTVPTDGAQRISGDHQHRQIAADVLSTADGSGQLRAGLLYYNASERRWIGADTPPTPGRYTALDRHPDHPLAPAVAAGLDRRGLAYNLVVEYRTDDGGRARDRVVYQGPPGGRAVTVTRSVVVTDGMVPAAAPTSPDGDDCTLGELTGAPGCRSGAYVAPDAAPASDRYNVLDVRLTVWST